MRPEAQTSRVRPPWSVSRPFPFCFFLASGGASERPSRCGKRRRVHGGPPHAPGHTGRPLGGPLSRPPAAAGPRGLAGHRVVLLTLRVKCSPHKHAPLPVPSPAGFGPGPDRVAVLLSDAGLGVRCRPKKDPFKCGSGFPSGVLSVVPSSSGIFLRLRRACWGRCPSPPGTLGAPPLPRSPQGRAGGAVLPPPPIRLLLGYLAPVQPWRGQGGCRGPACGRKGCSSHTLQVVASREVHGAGERGRGSLLAAQFTNPTSCLSVCLSR